MKFAITVIILLVLIVICYYFCILNYNQTGKNSLVKTTTNLFSEELIPKIIIQTWKTNIVPQRFIGLINSVKKNNPDYKYMFFTDNRIEDFFKLYYPEYYNTYMNLPIKIQQIDFFRYVAIYHYGGFYLDLDMTCLKPFDDLLSNECVFPVDEYLNNNLCDDPRYKNFCKNKQYFLLGQYGFAAIPRHPFIKQLVDKIHNNLNKYIKTVDFNSEDYVYKTTGPDFVTEVYMNYNDKASIYIVENGKRQFFGDYAQHNFFGSWKR